MNKDTHHLPLSKLELAIILENKEFLDARRLVCSFTSSNARTTERASEHLKLGATPASLSSALYQISALFKSHIMPFY